jgi:predicted DNA-binding protein (MmcQ/YjbR family)
MDAEIIREYCLAKKGVTEGFPFDEVTLVFKVGGKMFALVSLDGDLAINLKCDPELAIELREQYACVEPGFHMAKSHWNTIQVDGSVSDKLIREWIDHSYELVKSSLPRKTRESLDK